MDGGLTLSFGSFYLLRKYLKMRLFFCGVACNVPFEITQPKRVPSPPATVNAAILPSLMTYSPIAIASFHFCQSTSEFGNFMNLAGIMFVAYLSAWAGWEFSWRAFSMILDKSSQFKFLAYSDKCNCSSFE
jgi:hypothetical protein